MKIRGYLFSTKRKVSSLILYSDYISKAAGFRQITYQHLCHLCQGHEISREGIRKWQEQSELETRILRRSGKKNISISTKHISYGSGGKAEIM